ncbi:MAG: bifunctional 23S rRNA (guanine(2069)-N(7))-methyltransferase RlmK/23S rRNA (guanine(2445)-N(2))-methyltransferase RlmL [Enterobacterales bacterium]|nr:bifunctional 23S rRNA (guanine(2069)-N(7))-methyltransferase RlmK/23S rRNA (guanine(2445)-N(2))-methyltransferase RlmL [Enterobacterales bacterium]
MPQFFATCATSLEYLLVDELTELGAENVKEGLSLVNFEASWPQVYDILMWSRIASRVLYPIAHFEAKDDQTLYDQVAIIDWSQHIKSDNSFLVHAQSFRSEMSHTQFISQRIKDAVVDHFTDMDEQRPDVEFNQPDVVIQCRIRQNQVTLSIDLAGVGLHRRSYRQQGGIAPIKENLACALLTRAGWLQRCKTQRDLVLYDPMCGSGTFLIEAAMMALDIAPGIFRDYLGLFGWRQFQPELWQASNEKAELKRQQAQDRQISLGGSDINPKAIFNATANIENIGLQDVISVSIAALDQLDQISVAKKGLLIVNPPYALRLGDTEQVLGIYHELGNLLKQHFDGWNASVISPDKQFGHQLKIRAKKIYKFNNGSIACELLNLDISESHFLAERTTQQVDTGFKQKLDGSALELSNRLEKNRKGLKKYLQREDISCYRIYDADLPEYNAAIDVYNQSLHIQEYKAPKTIDPQIALRRIKELERVVAGVFKLPLAKVHLKQRRQQKGDWQYQASSNSGDKQQSKADSNNFTVTESGLKFKVNLMDYLDTGLFLDHRKTRKLVGEVCCGKDFLNLFCYTAAFSIYAAKMGAKSTTNVDMSNTYLSWAKDNFALNNINLEKHHFARDDTLQWLQDAIQKKERYHVILLDPPTFSNSKKMLSHFDVQQDHINLINSCLELLHPQGVLFFSNNFHQFKMEYIGDEQVRVTEITKQTTSQDFFRRPLHRCWKIEKQ